MYKGSMETKLSAKSQKVLEVLKTGGRIHAHSENEIRLRDSQGDQVKGIGPASLKELLDAGLLTRQQVGMNHFIYRVK